MSVVSNIVTRGMGILHRLVTRGFGPASGRREVVRLSSALCLGHALEGGLTLSAAMYSPIQRTVTLESVVSLEDRT